MLKCFPSQIGQVQKSLESCMDKQTVEFQTQVRSYLILLRLPFLPLPLHQSFAGGRNKNCNQPEGESLQDNEQDLWTVLQVFCY